MDLTFKPIDQWTGKLRQPHERKKARFTLSYHSILDQLRSELRHLQAKDVVALLACSDYDLRRDGVLRASARLEHPGVVIVIGKSAKGSLRFSTDLYNTWQDNLRGIAEALEGLRTFSRHGVGQGDEQYAGYTALPPGQPEAPARWKSAAEAKAWLANLAGVDPSRSFEAIFRAAALKAHPDTGGNADIMEAVNEARRVAEGGAL